MKLIGLSISKKHLIEIIPRIFRAKTHVIDGIGLNPPHSGIPVHGQFLKALSHKSIVCRL